MQRLQTSGVCREGSFSLQTLPSSGMAKVRIPLRSQHGRRGDIKQSSQDPAHARGTKQFSHSASCTPCHPSFSFTPPALSGEGLGPMCSLTTHLLSSERAVQTAETVPWRERGAPATGLILQCILDLSKQQREHTAPQAVRRGWITRKHTQAQSQSREKVVL